MGQGKDKYGQLILTVENPKCFGWQRLIIDSVSQDTK